MGQRRLCSGLVKSWAMSHGSCAVMRCWHKESPDFRATNAVSHFGVLHVLPHQTVRRAPPPADSWKTPATAPPRASACLPPSAVSKTSEASGKLDTLLRSGARFSETAVLMSSLEDGTLETLAMALCGAPKSSAHCGSGPVALRLVEHLAAGRSFGFSLERAVFATVLHRLVVSGSDRACDAWLDAYQMPGAPGI